MNYRKGNPFSELYCNINKQEILQECTVFDQKVLDQEKCQLILCRLIYLFSMKIKLTEEETSNLFF